MKKVLFTQVAALLATVMFAQSTTLKGKVSDKDGQSVSSVSVILKGTDVGSYTDNNFNCRCASKL